MRRRERKGRSDMTAWQNYASPVGELLLAAGEEVIQSAHRINTQRIIQIICYRRLIKLLLCAAHDPSGFVKKKQYFFFIFMDRYIVCTDLIFQADFLTAFCFFSVSRLDHMPASLKYLFILIFSSIVLLYNFLYILSTVKF